MEKKKVQTVENTPIVDATRTGETVHALLHRPFESLRWSMLPNEVERLNDTSRSMASETDTVKQVLHSPLTDCTDHWQTAIRLVVCPIASFLSTIHVFWHSLDVVSLEYPSCQMISKIGWPLLHVPMISPPSKASKSGSLPILEIPTTNSEQ
ncbi:hypothetical protein TNCV_3482351 [Trichonephila clavipes]|nr:hypothetical protein TNCV_3482351 [Trichonephila clavipes]